MALILMVMDKVPAVLSLAYLLMCTVSFIAYVLDQDAAGKPRRQRTPEASLHMLDLQGGWPGALIAQQQSRHKTVKASFQAAFWCTVLTNLAGAARLVRGGVVNVSGWLREAATWSVGRKKKGRHDRPLQLARRRKVRLRP